MAKAEEALKAIQQLIGTESSDQLVVLANALVRQNEILAEAVLKQTAEMMQRQQQTMNQVMTFCDTVLNRQLALISSQAAVTHGRLSRVRPAPAVSAHRLRDEQKPSSSAAAGGPDFFEIDDDDDDVRFEQNSESKLGTGERVVADLDPFGAQAQRVGGAVPFVPPR